MGNIPSQTVICKCLDFLDISDESCPIFNYRAQKLTFVKTVKLLIAAILNKRSDLDDITNSLKANKALRAAIGLDAISSSQVSRKLSKLPLDVLQGLFFQVTGRLDSLLKRGQGIPGIGKLRIVDSTSLTLPRIAGNWAYYSKGDNGVKIHTQLLVVNADTLYPAKVVCSTRGVADSEVMLELVVDDDAVHVLDRGYIVYRHFKHWSDNGIRFVGRIQNKNKTAVVIERDVNEEAGIIRDADVIVTFKSNGVVTEATLRLVEFTDEKGRFFRVLTSVWDLPAEQISQIYRHRWKIETFFKWIKQHLSFVHLYGYKPEAVWNQIYLALIAYGLTLLVAKETSTKRTPWDLLKLLRHYMHQPWELFVSVLNHKPTRTSLGRRKKKTGGHEKDPPHRQSVKLLAD